MEVKGLLSSSRLLFVISDMVTLQVLQDHARLCMHPLKETFLCFFVTNEHNSVSYLS